MISILFIVPEYSTRTGEGGICALKTSGSPQNRPKQERTDGQGCESRCAAELQVFWTTG